MEEELVADYPEDRLIMVVPEVLKIQGEFALVYPAMDQVQCSMDLWVWAEVHLTFAHLLKVEEVVVTMAEDPENREEAVQVILEE